MVEDHPLFRGTLGCYGRSCANHVVAEADLVIYAGGNTSDQSTANWKIPKEGTRIIHIDLDPTELGRNYTRRDRHTGRRAPRAGGAWRPRFRP